MLEKLREFVRKLKQADGFLITAVIVGFCYLIALVTDLLANWLFQVTINTVGFILLTLTALLGLSDWYTYNACHKYPSLSAWCKSMLEKKLLDQPCMWLIGWLGFLHYFILALL